MTVPFSDISGSQNVHEINLKEGFYEIAYEGTSKYIIKHESSFYVKEGLTITNILLKIISVQAVDFSELKTKTVF